MEILGKILGSPARVKIMRLFLLNRDKGFNIKDVIKRSRTDPDMVRRELKLLSSINFVKKHGTVWFFNYLFKYTSELEGLLVSADTFDKQTIISGFKKVGKVKLIVISGIFLKEKNSRVDLLIVGDKMQKGKIQEEIRKIEAEIGSELVYAVFDTKEFIYRLNMYDKLVWDIFDFPHEIVLQSKELSTQAFKKA